jgi:SAM-dependent methyltransferase
MADIVILEWFIKDLSEEPNQFSGKRVLEVGSRYVNGGVRPLIQGLGNPIEYVGVDITPGKFVDVLCSAENLVEKFGAESFDAVISTEMIEHTRNWRVAIGNMKSVLKKGGTIFVTTRTVGFPYHGYPYDYWRYSTNSIANIFSDFELIKNEDEQPLALKGVLLKAKKPNEYNQTDLSKIALYSMSTGEYSIEPRELTRRRKVRLGLRKLDWLKLGFNVV